MAIDPICGMTVDEATGRTTERDGVFSGEGEVALALTESVLRELGAIPEQIDRERERVRVDLFGSPDPAEAEGPIDGSPAVDSVPPGTPGPRQLPLGEGAGQHDEPRPRDDGAERPVPPES